MTTIILSTLLSIAFYSLGLLHLYWLFGGKLGLSKVIPTEENEESNIPIPYLATFLVALILLFFGFLYTVKSGYITVNFPSWINYIYWFIPTIFLVRSIGDFKYVGFFKKIKNTEFAKYDTKLFSPLCLILGTVGIVVIL